MGSLIESVWYYPSRRRSPLALLASGLLVLLSVPGEPAVAAEAIATGQMCVAEELGFPTGSFCTANNVGIDSFEVLSGPSSCVQGQTINVVLKAHFDTNANVQVEDVGFFLPEPTNVSAKDGSSCYRDFLNPLQAQGDACANDNDCTGVATGGDECANGFCYPSAQATTGPYPDVDGDDCGDAPDGGIGPYAFTLNNGNSIALTCNDGGVDGVMDIVLCTTWQDDGEAECSDASGLAPKTTSMCNCQTVQLEIEVNEPECGNDVVETPETCEPPGTATCDDQCMDREPLCGDGFVTAPETCEPPGTATCNDQCMDREPLCGDGFVTAPETCEPPGTTTCDGQCMDREPVCGDGFVTAPETCEPPGTDTCDGGCMDREPQCGDGFVTAPETCEPPATDTCDGQCMLVEVEEKEREGCIPRPLGQF